MWCLAPIHSPKTPKDGVSADRWKPSPRRPHRKNHCNLTHCLPGDCSFCRLRQSLNFLIFQPPTLPLDLQPLYELLRVQGL